jgi:uncharacterized membrane protein YdjX (TVP38/TMEM64 family)
MSWLAAVLLRVGELGLWGVLLFILLYVAAAVTLAPAFVLSVAAGALFGVWKGSVLVLVSATLGATAAYGVARMISGTRLVKWILRDRRVDVVRRAVAHEGAWVQFLLRLSPVVPYVLLNYALGVYGVRLRDFWLACFGMMPTIIMYAYYGKVCRRRREDCRGYRAAPRSRVLRVAHRRSDCHVRRDDGDHAGGTARNRADAAESIIHSTW